jgi:hypothetical protein
LPHLWDQVSRASAEIYSEAGLSDQAAREGAAAGLYVYSIAKNTIFELNNTVGEESPDQVENPLGYQINSMYSPSERAVLMERLAHLNEAYDTVISSVVSDTLRIRAYKLNHNGREPSADHPLMQKDRCRVQIVHNSMIDLDPSGHYSEIANWEKAVSLGEQTSILLNPSLAPELTPSCRKILLQR